ncbi:hypothetical protein ACODT5_28755 [Streptomyces sp. 5.8]|uniref:hypothetical protein n=1 Tax=Streptomyces sp. 5.8 TaxID=3406571 RepID=UPI003BB6FBD0
MSTITAPYGYRVGDDRHILVHVVAGKGWTTREIPAKPDSLWAEYREARTITSAWAMCGAGLDGPAPAEGPGEGQKWCRECVQPERRELLRTRF